MRTKLLENVAIGAALVCIAIDTVIDVQGTYELALSLNHSLAWVLAGALTAVMYFMQPLLAKVYGVQTDFAPETETWREIDPSIIDRWEAVQREFGIDPFDGRADITEFGDVLDQIEQAEAARLGCSIRAVRVELGARVMILMRETLGPLAAELAYLDAEENRIQILAITTLAEQRQHEQDVAAELLACTPI